MATQQASPCASSGTSTSILLLPLLLLLFPAWVHAQKIPLLETTTTINLTVLASKLQAAPPDDSAEIDANLLVLPLPMPDGSERPFKFVRRDLMSADFAAQFPDFKTYKIEAADAPGIRGRATVTPHGLMVHIFSPEGFVEIVPLDLLSPSLHRVALYPSLETDFLCGTDDSFVLKDAAAPPKAVFTNGTTRRNYKLAIVTTGEFGQTHGGTVSSASAVVVSQINALEDLYEKELAVRFTLLTPAIYLDPNTDPFPSTSTNRTLMAAEAVAMNFPNVNDYDFGHALHSTGGNSSWGGGIAYVGVLCFNVLISGSSTGYYKAGAWSTVGSSTSGALGTFGHEVGHQFSMLHTFNGTGGSCTSNISSVSGYEIGSGTTIMSYNGLCSSTQNVPGGGAADLYFYHTNLEAAINEMTSISCGTSAASGNTPPVVTANPCGGSTTIPKSTPFRLTGSGTDADGDPIYYTWEQSDEDGSGTTTQGFIGSTAAASTVAPLFRAYPPTTSPSRTFPIMELVAANNYASSFEPLPSVARTIKFQFTGRDWKTVGGGVNSALLSLTVSASGPFSVTAPNGGETLTAGNSSTVTWDVNGTNAFCTNVNIKLSVDGGLTFPYTLATSTPNDGSHSVTIPAGAVNSSNARIMVECADNTCVVFFDVSNSNFSISSTCNATISNVCPVSPLSAAAGNAALNLNMDNYYGSSFTTKTFNIVSTDPDANIPSFNTAGTGCIHQGWNNDYKNQTFSVSESGTYTFSISGSANFSGIIIYTASGYSPPAACNGFVSSNYRDTGTGSTNILSNTTATLTACTDYVMVASNLNATAPFSVTVTISGPGNVMENNASPGASYSYTYVAVNSSNNQIAAVSATSNFTSLSAGSYIVYGASYYSGAGPSPATVSPATWVGQTIEQILSSGNCALFSANSRPVVITSGCTPPTAGLTKSGDLSCSVTSVTLTATPATGMTYAWSAGATPISGTNTATVTAAGTYTVTVTDTGTSCTATASVSVSANTTPPVAGLSKSGNLSCSTTSVTLTATPATGATYSWSAGATPIGSTNTATVTAAGTYTV
ncbi:MAG: hypothetical protein RI973_753, partial [Bacteroidota bacterium]